MGGEKDKRKIMRIGIGPIRKRGNSRRAESRRIGRKWEKWRSALSASPAEALLRKRTGRDQAESPFA
jgi:hypothetical protein